jgi:hypothetical protein
MRSRSLQLGWWVIGLIAVCLTTVGIAMAEPQASLRADGEPHTGMPFGITLIVDGFEESPPPAFPKLQIAGVQVVEDQIAPSVSQRLEIINGRRTASTIVRWMLTWRVTPIRDGELTIPNVTVVQGSKQATAKGGVVEVKPVPTTDDMQFSLSLPNRPVWVGESIPVDATWTLRRNVTDQTFLVPIFSMPDDFVVSAPAATDPRKTLAFAAGKSELRLPFVQEQIEGGATKFRFTFYMAPRRAGKVEIPASSVVADLAVGRADFFGNSATKAFRTSDIAQTLEVKELPQSNRPDSFNGAVGTSFSIAATASRSVVQLGEPVELTFTIKGDQRLDALALGTLSCAPGASGGLPKDTFTVPAEAAVGSLSEDGKTKVFRVQVQAIAATNQVPAVAFSYFDPIGGSYKTIATDPIALSVNGTAMVGASDVVSASKASGSAAGPAPSQPSSLSLVGADLSLSTASNTSSGLSRTALLVALAILYILPLVIFATRYRLVATATDREEASEVRNARKALSAQLQNAVSAPARDVAGGLATSLRNLAKVCSNADEASSLVTELESQGYAPTATEPLSVQLRERIGAAAAAWKPIKRSTSTKASVSSALVVVIMSSGLYARPAAASDDTRSQALAIGREAYQNAMSQTDASARQQAFAKAKAQLASAARTNRSADVVADWGNAALGSGDVATATLAFRRALLIDPSHARSLQNLSWLRSRQPESLRLATAGATETLLFFQSWPVWRKLLLGAVAFAIAVLLITPWRGRRTKWWPLALGATAVWMALTGSALLTKSGNGDAVLLDTVTLRAADNQGAPAAVPEPVPAGVEVQIETTRGDWMKVRTAAGSVGWVAAGAVERVAI